MRVLLLHPPLQVNYNHIDYPALSSLALWQNAACLKHHGYEIRVLDAFSLSTSQKTSTKPYFYIGPEKKEFIRELSKESFDVAIIHLDQYLVQYPQKEFLSGIIAACRKLQPNAKLILADMHIGGMNYVAYDPARFLESKYAPDWLVRFESEMGLLTLLEAIQDGVSHRIDSGKPVDSALLPGPISTFDDSIYEMVDINLYLDFLTKYTESDDRVNPFKLDGTTIPFKSSRGCCFDCNFCTSHPSGMAKHRRQWRPLVPEEMESQIDKISRNTRVEKLFVIDEAANIGQDHFSRLLSHCEKHHLKLEFPNGLRADKLNRKFVERLAEKISLLSLSPESGSKNILSNVIGKKQTLAEVQRATLWAYDNKLPTALHFMIGMPGEKRTDIAKTFAFAQKMFEDYGAEPWLQFAIPIPGTALFEECEKQGLLPDELPIDYNPLFQGNPMLKNGSVEVPNGEMKRLKKALEDKVRKKIKSE